MTTRVIREEVTSEDDERVESVGIAERDKARPEEAEISHFVVHIAVHNFGSNRYRLTTMSRNRVRRRKRVEVKEVFIQEVQVTRRALAVKRDRHAREIESLEASVTLE